MRFKKRVIVGVATFGLLLGVGAGPSRADTSSTPSMGRWVCINGVPLKGGFCLFR